MVDGFTLLELLLVLSVTLVLGGIALAQALAGVGAARTTGATRFVSSRLMQARAQAVQRSTAIAIRFDTDSRGVLFTTYQDGNHNGDANHNSDARRPALQGDRHLHLARLTVQFSFRACETATPRSW